ncbi:hypothetical protein EK21DRAFT_92863 [Setomelanomma holmii]|uniref:Uncharacterized protein n=1 Tax=Setomelanomma holmii TaxID=210430 RepID=A0A9P4LHX2_9PLEO|nr:hypothetical protein EK21DRAFT_92863 [Setomelanomma holmii]
MDEAFGLPHYNCTRDARNFFSHDYLTPRRSAQRMQEAMHGKTKLYNGLFRQVATTKKMLEHQLADADLWTAPKPAKIYFQSHMPEVQWPPVSAWDENSADGPLFSIADDGAESGEEQPGRVYKSLRFAYFRSKLDEYGRAITDLDEQFDAGQGGFGGDEGYVSHDTEDEVDDRGTPEVVAVSVV